MEQLHGYKLVESGQVLTGARAKEELFPHPSPLKSSTVITLEPGGSH